MITRRITIIHKLLFVAIAAFPLTGYSDQKSQILSESPDGQYVVRDDSRLEEVGRDQDSSDMFLVEKSSGKRVMELPRTKYRSPQVAWTPDSKYLAVAETTRSSYLECYHKLENGEWKKCEIVDGELLKLLKDMNVSFQLAFDRAGKLCVLLSMPNAKDGDPIEMIYHYYDVEIRRYALSQEKLELLESKSLAELVPMTREGGQKVQELIENFEGGLFPRQLTSFDHLLLYKKMDANFRLGYYVTNKKANLNILKIADYVPGTNERLLRSNCAEGDGQLMVLLAPIKKGLKPKLYLIKKQEDEVRSAKLDNAQVAGYVESAIDMCFDEHNHLYLLCEKEDVWGKVALTIATLTWENGIRAEEISHKIVAVGERQKTIEKMEADTRSGDKPLNLIFGTYGRGARMAAEAKAKAEGAAPSAGH